MGKQSNEIWPPIEYLDHSRVSTREGSLTLMAVTGRDVRKTNIRELLVNGSNHVLPALALAVPFLELVSFFVACIPPNGADVDHAIAKLNERASHRRQPFQVGDIPQAELGEFLILLFAKPLDEGVGWEGLAEAERSQTVLRETEVEHGGDGDGRGAKLFLLFGKVGASYLGRCQCGIAVSGWDEDVQSQWHTCDGALRVPVASPSRQPDGLGRGCHRHRRDRSSP